MSHQFARHLRKNLTDAERFAWERLRYRQIGGFKFRRQVELGRFIADFVCLERRLIVELDGGQHATQVEADAVRTQWLESQGFRVIRFWDHEVLQEGDAVVEVIYQHLEMPAPHPNPPPQGGREQERTGRRDRRD